MLDPDAIGAREHANPDHAAKAQPGSKKRQSWSWWIKLPLWLTLVGILVVGGFLFWYAHKVYPTLPAATNLNSINLQEPVRIYTQDGQLISIIGEKKRQPVEYDDIPPWLIQAVISSEDSDFFNHFGLNLKGIGRAVYELITTGEKQTGGSSITMQVARNFYLTREKTFLRKFNEMVMALKIERELSKQQIITLYLNKIFLGYRSYGVAAAASTYYGKTLDQLDLDEVAMIAGLPKAPSRFNPISNPKRAKLRRNYVLKRMYDLGYIDRTQYVAATARAVHAKHHGRKYDVEADYVAEMVRQYLVDTYGTDSLDSGYKIYTTLSSALQSRANKAVRTGLVAYERRHGYKGPLDHIDNLEQVRDDWEQILAKVNTWGYLIPAIVTHVNEHSIRTFIDQKTSVDVQWQGLKWAKPFIDVNNTGDEPETAADILTVGDIVLLEAKPVEITIEQTLTNAEFPELATTADVVTVHTEYWLAQEPAPEGLLVSLNPQDGAVKALVGGYDYHRSKFNRVTQSQRQLGSSFKPFLYSSALEKNHTVASTINDAPVVFRDQFLEDVWRPENYSGKSYGLTRLRVALTHSRNLVSIRLLQQLGIRYAINYVKRFGFDATQLNKTRNLSLALGAVQLSPMEVVAGYATFANGGYKVQPYFIDHITDANDNVVFQSEPRIVCHECAPNDPLKADKIISPQNAYLMTSMMQDVIRYGSARRANTLNRMDIAGKTGTTNEQKDAWFSGFNPDVVTSVWVGYDQPETLGKKEVGGRAALPIWMDYMQLALTESPNVAIPKPEGLVNIRIDPKTGLAAEPNDPSAIFEIFREPFAPQPLKPTEIEAKEVQELAEELF